MKMVHMISTVLILVGGLNWGLIGLGGFMGANWNIINLILGSWPTLEWLVYVLVGVGAVVIIATHKRDCRYCNPGGGMSMGQM